MISQDAYEIVSGAWCPWLDYPGIAEPSDWLREAQATLDDTDSDLAHLLAEWQLADAERLDVLPDNEDWREPEFIDRVLPVMRSEAA